MSDITLFNQDGKILASSRDVAEKFGKNHKEILRTIDNISKESVQRNFALYLKSLITKHLMAKQIKSI